MKDKFLLKVPLDEDDLTKGYQELRFKTYVDIGKYLNIGPHTVRCIAEGTAKFATSKTKYLQNIIIEKLETKVKEFTPPKTEEERRAYLQRLREKAREYQD
jgi:hypothetical protein